MIEGEDTPRNGSEKSGAFRLPSWVPASACHYLEHTETGAPIRALARRAGCHASTVLRHVRDFETRRDDLLVDEALRRLGRRAFHRRAAGSSVMETWMTAPSRSRHDDGALSEHRLMQDGQRILRRLCERGAVLAVSADLDKAAVVRETQSGTTARTAIVDREIAEAMALKAWISCDTPGRVARYRITGAGREALNHMLAGAENRALGFAEAPLPFAPVDADGQGDAPLADRARKRPRSMMSETPVMTLARRKDRDGAPFLTEDLVRAGERLREDFELARLGPRANLNWDRFLTSGMTDGRGSTASGGSDAARLRVERALRDLGPELGEVALRCCCYLDGVERTEQRMGWSARSGKIVLRIALQRLRRFYDGPGCDGGLIG